MTSEYEIISAKEALARSNEAFIIAKQDLIRQINTNIASQASAGKTITTITFSPNHTVELINNVVELIKAAGYKVNHIESASIPYKYEIEWGF